MITRSDERRAFPLTACIRILSTSDGTCQWTLMRYWDRISSWKLEHDRSNQFPISAYILNVAADCVRFRRSTKFPPPQEGRGGSIYEIMQVASIEWSRYLEKGICFSVRFSIPWSGRNWAAMRPRTAPDWPGAIARISNQDGGWRHRERARMRAWWGKTTVFLYSFPGHVGGLSRQTYVNANGSGQPSGHLYLLPDFVRVS